MKEIHGDLIKMAEASKFQIIAQGCNCFCTMGGGFARTVKDVFPGAYKIDCETKKGDINKLGTYSLYSHYEKDFTGPPVVMIANCYTQYGYNPDDKPFDYEAFTLCMRKLNHRFPGYSIGLPLIGAGLAGGDWDRIKTIIEKELKDIDVTIVHYKQD